MGASDGAAFRKLFDFKVTDDALVFDEFGEPQLAQGLEVVITDVKHRVRVSGLKIKLIGLEEEKHQPILEQIGLIVEEDEHIEPGTAVVGLIAVQRGGLPQTEEDPSDSLLTISAITIDGQDLQLDV